MGEKNEERAATSDLHEQDGLLAASTTPLAGGPGFARRYLVRSLEVLMYWMPVWVLLILLAQIGTRGLRPAVEEEQRLIEHERALLERLESDEAHARELYTVREAMSDDIYQERLRRRDQDEIRAEIEERGLHPREPELDGDPEQASR